jgi:hypothetical protein
MADPIQLRPKAVDTKCGLPRGLPARASSAANMTNVSNPISRLDVVNPEDQVADMANCTLCRFGRNRTGYTVKRTTTPRTNHITLPGANHIALKANSAEIDVA